MLTSSDTLSFLRRYGKEKSIRNTHTEVCRRTYKNQPFSKENPHQKAASANIGSGKTRLFVKLKTNGEPTSPPILSNAVSSSDHSSFSICIIKMIIELWRKATSKKVDNSLVIVRGIDCTFIYSVTMQDKLFKKHFVSSFIHNVSQDLFQRSECYIQVHLLLNS